MIDPAQSEEVIVSFRTLAMLGGVVLLAIHFYRLCSRVSRHRDGHQEIERPSQFGLIEESSPTPRPRIRAMSTPAIGGAVDEGSR
jgi:hypothetical protein